MCKLNFDEEDVINELKDRTGFDEISIGCYMSNYDKKYICTATDNGYCKDLSKCRVLESICKEK